MTSVPERKRLVMVSFSRMSKGEGEGTTRLHPLPVSFANFHLRSCFNFEAAAWL